MLTTILTLCFSGLLAFSPAAAASLQGISAPDDRGSETRIALELMDLDSPEAGQEEMELPPLKAGEPAKPTASQAETPKAPPAPTMETGALLETVPKAEVSLPPLKPLVPAREQAAPRPAAPAVGLSPMILPAPPPVVLEQELKPLDSVANGEPRLGSIVEPGSLKSVASPAAKDQGLKLPATGAGGPAESAQPEMPILLGTGDREEPDAFMASPLPVKPVQKTFAIQGPQESPGVLAEAGTAGKSTASAQELDQKLVEIYERFYRNR